MNPFVRAASEWAELIAVEQSSFGQIDIDNLVDDELPADAISLAVDCARAIQIVLLNHRSALEVAIAIPLPPTDSQDLPKSSPALSEILDMPWRYGPGREVPGLYVLDPVRWLRDEEGEEYRRILSDPRTPKGFTLVYSAWRSHIEGVRGWPYNRCFWLRSQQL